MKKHLNFTYYCLLMLPLIISCDDSEVELPFIVELPSVAFSKTYTASDFDLGKHYDYWEVRRGPSDPDLDEYDVISKYDDVDSLEPAQLEILADASAERGFSNTCLPGSCPIYIVALDALSAEVIDSTPRLIEFFGDIDTEAELYFYMNYAQDHARVTTPLMYEEDESGYTVLLFWDTLCGSKGEDLVKVHRDGTIEKLEEVSRTSYNVCA